MLDLKKYYGEMKKLTIAELVLNAVTFLCILFLFVLPCFTASVEYNPDILISESENAVQKIFYDKVRAALRAELLQGNDPETITFSFSIAEEIKLIISAFRSGYSELYILFMLYFLIPVAFGAGFLCTSASNAVKRCKRLFSNEIDNATLLFFNDIKTGTDKKKKKNAYDQYNAVSVVILIVVEMIFFRWFGANLSFMAHASGISAVGYFAILLALIACGFNFYTNKQKKKLKTTLLKADYEDRQAVEAALQRSPFDLHTPAANATVAKSADAAARATNAARIYASHAEHASLLSTVYARLLRTVCANARRSATAATATAPASANGATATDGSTSVATGSPHRRASQPR